MKKYKIVFIVVLSFLVGGPAFADKAGCLRPLAEKLADWALDNGPNREDMVLTTESFIEEFAGNIAKCRDYLMPRNSSENFSFNEGGLNVTMDWDAIKNGVDAKLGIQRIRIKLR